MRSACVLCLLLLSSPALPEEAGESAAQPQQTFVPNIVLPEGEGKALLESACIKCHDLAGLSAYQGYWNRTQWRFMVDTMVRNGATLNEAQAELVTDYLTRFFGPGTR